MECTADIQKVRMRAVLKITLHFPVPKGILEGPEIVLFSIVVDKAVIFLGCTCMHSFPDEKIGAIISLIVKLGFGFMGVGVANKFDVSCSLGFVGVITLLATFHLQENLAIVDRNVAGYVSNAVGLAATRLAATTNTVITDNGVLTDRELEGLILISTFDGIVFRAEIVQIINVSGDVVSDSTILAHFEVGVKAGSGGCPQEIQTTSVCCLLEQGWSAKGAFSTAELNLHCWASACNIFFVSVILQNRISIANDRLGSCTSPRLRISHIAHGGIATSRWGVIQAAANIELEISVAEAGCAPVLKGAAQSRKVDEVIPGSSDTLQGVAFVVTAHQWCKEVEVIPAVNIISSITASHFYLRRFPTSKCDDGLSGLNCWVVTDLAISISQDNVAVVQNWLILEQANRVLFAGLNIRLASAGFDIVATGQSATKGYLI